MVRFRVSSWRFSAARLSATRCCSEMSVFGPEPPCDAPVLVPERLNTGQKGPEDPVCSLEGEHHIERLARGDGLLPSLKDAGQDGGIVDGLPTPALHLGRGGARVFIPAPVIPEYPARGV